MQQILFVHDDQEPPHTRKNYLEMSGFEVVMLKNGEECMKALAQQKPALVLMDVLIEGKNGFEVCRMIRGLCKPHEVPIILCSHVYRSRIYRDEAIAAGAQRFLLMPVRLEELLVNVMELVSRPAKAR